MLKGLNKLTLTLLAIILIGCCKTSIPQKGFSLQEFKIANKELDKVVKIISKEFYSQSQSKNISNLNLLLDLRESKDTIPEFWFTYFDDNDDLRERIIYRSNKRIVGYINCNNIDVILISSIAYKSDFEELFCKFIYPTNNTKQFDFLYFPANQYQFNKYIVAKDKADSLTKWVTEAEFFDPAYIVFRYENGKMVNLK